MGERVGSGQRVAHETKKKRIVTRERERARVEVQRSEENKARRAEKWAQARTGKTRRRRTGWI